MANKSDNLINNLIILQNAFGAGSHTAVRIVLSLYEKGLLEKEMKEIISIGVLTEKISDHIKPKLKSADRIIPYCQKNGIRIIGITDVEYPAKLRNIPAPPLVLYIRGELPCIDDLPSVCIVGPRKVTDFGEKAAYSIAYRLSRAGVIIVSGGALGSDSAAHKGALNGEGKTVAVLACGLDYDYLAENRPLRNRISKNGCLISEYPPQTPVSRYSFPVRNRIMSGLCDATIVVEAGSRSGALITARHAAEQGREVFAIPGNPTFPEYIGSNSLLRDGATPFLKVDDVFSLLNKKYPDKLDIENAYKKTAKTVSSQKIQKKSCESLSKNAKIVYNHLDKPNFSADDLLLPELSDDDLLSALTELEIEHFIKAMPGGNYSLI